MHQICHFRRPFLPEPHLIQNSLILDHAVLSVNIAYSTKEYPFFWGGGVVIPKSWMVYHDDHCVTFLLPSELHILINNMSYTIVFWLRHKM